ncbi:DNA-binding transcriptional regulator, MerR family [Saccharopolyspora kobensis]|uniref:DNA-binding transcriptional regulator, MerR family n=1 Tax=Saccharopolyspora kobensis TaxID=146035 RepID=A0A1H6BIG7_9PSEU|nr:MerR family transcriptional regulator [Saccharopolyspora kobensis]SEG59996.1 DNA-binding transcriptional regulator, MerR family [Saccharopolyspora kobensis]SFE89332.1 DNA-binding transcriptional regulator, MerR family [Saccharopolyspora kobensis]
MFSIGDFARHGRVSVRMLRHYDAIGLLPPAHVDRSTGHRAYHAAQLARLNRIVALKELGFTLQQVQQILDEGFGAEQLRGMLALRQAELQNRIEADTARLADVRARLRVIEAEGTMPTEEVTMKSLPAVRLAEMSGTARTMDPQSIGPVIQGLYAELCAALERAGVATVGPATAYYVDSADGELTTVHAGLPVNVEPDPALEFDVVDLPAVAQAATIVHRGPMDDCLPTYQALLQWMEATGRRPADTGREVTLACPEDPAGMVTEIQLPVRPD